MASRAWLALKLHFWSGYPASGSSISYFPKDPYNFRRSPPGFGGFDEWEAEGSPGMVGNDSRSIVPALAASGAAPQAGPSNVIRPSRTSTRWYLRNWRMRWRVLGLVPAPTVAALTLGALRVQAASTTAATASRTARLGVLGSDLTTLAEAVEDERDLTA